MAAHGERSRSTPKNSEVFDAPKRELGFRHFLENPAPTERFRIYGFDPHKSRETLDQLRDLMRRLSLRMDADMNWTRHHDVGARSIENPRIPSGYTYLLQLVSHDLVQSTVPLSTVADIAVAASNSRRSALNLETLYGSGPIGCPSAYALDDSADRSRTKLRLGRIQRDDRTSDDACPFRDIARATAENVTGIDRGKAGRSALTDALIADPRNDDHAILSQMTALFSLLHNGLVDLIARSEQAAPAQVPQSAYRRFLGARGATTLIYRNIVRRDLMKRILHPVIYDAYSGSDPQFIDVTTRGSGTSPSPNAQPVDPDWHVPLEFSHGAFRFGHALVRNQYRINDAATNELTETLEKTSVSDPINMPLNESWVVQWSQFFEIGESRPNLSHRIGPKFSYALGSSRFFPAVDATKRVGLAYRDLMSSSLAGLWSLNHLIAKIRAVRPDFIRLSPLLADRELRIKRLRAWLREEPAYGGFSSEDVNTLAHCPPLPFFFLWEAAFEPGAHGLRLGVLGSIIVAEVIFGRLSRQPLPAESGAADLTESMCQLSRSLYGTNLFAAVPDMSAMGQLITFVSEISCLQDAKPAFV